MGLLPCGGRRTAASVVKYPVRVFSVGMAEKVPGWLERVLLPQLNEVKGELKAVNARIDGVEGKIDGLEGKMEGEFKAVHSEINRLDEKVDGVDRRLGSKIDELDKRFTEKMDSFDKRLDITQRLAVVESKVHELETRN